jgi:hypothetical protein
LGLLPSAVFGNTREVVSVGEEFSVDGIRCRCVLPFVLEEVSARSGCAKVEHGQCHGWWGEVV